MSEFESQNAELTDGVGQCLEHLMDFDEISGTGAGLPAPACQDATPPGEVQVRVRLEPGSCQDRVETQFRRSDRSESTLNLNDNKGNEQADLTACRPDNKSVVGPL